jgi:predicted RNase H-like HicB family nuclease
MELAVDIHYEDGTYWAQVRELPGCFASGDSIPELIEAIEESVLLYLSPAPGDPSDQKRSMHLSSFGLSIENDRLQPA